VLTINELGEFSVPDMPDHDANRAKAYASCIAVEPHFENKPSIMGTKPKDRVCDICGRMFVAHVHNQLRCSPECKKEHYRRKSQERRKKGAE